MRRKVAILSLVALLVLGLVVTGYFFIANSQKKAKNDVWAGLMSRLEAESSSFTGTFKASEKVSYQINFKTSLVGNNSITNFELLLPNYLNQAKIKGKFLVIGDQEYIRFSDVTEVISKIPSDPLSLAIKANLLPSAKKYQNRWLVMSGDSTDVKLTGCADYIKSLKPDDQKIRQNYEKYIVVKSTKKTDRSDLRTYYLELNREALEVMPELGKCIKPGSLLTVAIDQKNKSIETFAYSNQTTSLVVNFNQSAIEPPVSPPKNPLQFSELQAELQSLFIN